MNSALRGRGRQVSLSWRPAWSTQHFQARWNYIVRPCVSNSSNNNKKQRSNQQELEMKACMFSQGGIQETWEKWMLNFVSHHPTAYPSVCAIFNPHLIMPAFNFSHLGHLGRDVIAFHGWLTAFFFFLMTIAHFNWIFSHFLHEL